MEFSNSQSTAVLHKDGPMLVLAGPGSGKTTVITQRVKNLITNYKIPPSSILVITFTKAAAQEMKQRFLQLMGEGSTRVTFGTFHAIFFLVLKTAYHYESANIIAEDQKYRLMREILSHYSLDYPDEQEFIANLLGEISRIKNEQIPLEHFYSAQCGENVFREIYRKYEAGLKNSRRIDFDDMLVYTYELFRERPDILAAWRRKYRYILIDEFQDINRIQFEIVRMMAAPDNHLFIVGDDDQSIYRFRGSRPELMLQFPKLYPDAGQTLLDVNYRSNASVVQASLKLIEHNKERFAKRIIPAKESGAPVRFLRFPGKREENLGILKEIESGLKKGMNYSDFAVLFRTNVQPRLLIEQLTEYNIPFRAKDRVPDLYGHWIAKDIFAYIRIAQGSRKRSDLLQIMNRPNRYIGRDSLQEEEAAFDVWEAYYEQQPWIAERIERLEYDLGQLRRMSPYAAVNYIRKGIGYDDYLKEYAEYRNISEEELIDTAEEIQAAAKGKKTFEEWDSHIRACTRELQRAAQMQNENTDAVTLATLHSAKGLEFPQVYLAGMEDGLFPSYLSITSDQAEEEIEEERRLAYVGITRAMQNLSITCAKQRMVRGEAQYNRVSRFVKEIPPALMSQSASEPVKMREQKVQAFWRAKEAFHAKPFAGSYQPVSDTVFDFGAAGGAADVSGTSGADVEAQRGKLGYGTGDRVVHQKFGEGVVTKIAAGGRDYEVTVQFDTAGVRKMFAVFAKLKRI